MVNHSIINIFIEEHLLNTYLPGVGAIVDAGSGTMRKSTVNTIINSDKDPRYLLYWVVHRVKKKLKIILGTVISEVWSCDLLYHKNTTPPCVDRFLFQKQWMQSIENLNLDLINFKLLMLTNQSDLSIKKEKRSFSVWSSFLIYCTSEYPYSSG